MNVNQLKAMLELQALQNLNFKNKTEPTQTNFFNDLLNSFILTEETPNSTVLENTLKTSVNAVSIMPKQLTKLSGSGEKFENIINEAAERYQIPA